MEKIRWGIIGCGDVTEIKSGPAFSKVRDSELVAVMRRDEEKLRDYATRHKVRKWYTSATDLIQDDEINAIYIATPPSSHETYALEAIRAGKPVYLEKPMSVNSASAARIARAAKDQQVKLSVAHYRRAQPLFKKLKDLLDAQAVGTVRLVRSELSKQALSKKDLSVPKTAWRVDESVAGGGLFHDLSPHQLDLMYYFFGEPMEVTGIATNQANLYQADDLVAGTILFQNGIVFNGTWCFNAAKDDEKDLCEIHGEKGLIRFSFFEHKLLSVLTDGKEEKFRFDPLLHVQQPMIEKVVDYFLDRGANPCSGDEGVAVMSLIDAITKKKE